MSTIMVTIGECQWTQEAIHLACVLARNSHTDVTLVKMSPVTHPGYLGATFADWDLTPLEHEQVQGYRQTAEDYGASLSLAIFQYVNFTDAVVDAAEEIEADFVFATIPPSSVPYVDKLRLWHLRRLLEREKRTLYTLEPNTPHPNWMPSITLSAHHK